MAINTGILGPQSKEEEEAFAIEALVFSVQISLQKAMQKHGVSNKELADRLGMTPARVSQIFATKGANLTLKTIARVQHALGEDFEFVRKQDVKTRKTAKKIEKFGPTLVQGNPSIWKKQDAHNTDKRLKLVA